MYCPNTVGDSQYPCCMCEVCEGNATIDSLTKELAEARADGIAAAKESATILARYVVERNAAITRAEKAEERLMRTCEERDALRAERDDWKRRAQQNACDLERLGYATAKREAALEEERDAAITRAENLDHTLMLMTAKAEDLKVSRDAAIAARDFAVEANNRLVDAIITAGAEAERVVAAKHDTSAPGGTHDPQPDPHAA